MACPFSKRMVVEEQFLRLLFSAFFVVSASVALVVAITLAVLQYLFRILTGNPSRSVAAWVSGISSFLGQALAYLGQSRADKPFPFAPWPASDAVPRYTIHASDQRKSL